MKNYTLAAWMVLTNLATSCATSAPAVYPEQERPTSSRAPEDGSAGGQHETPPPPSSPSLTFKAGDCAFGLPPSERWRVSREQGNRAVIEYQYDSGSGIKTANVDISCADVDYDAYVAENFEEHDGQPRFLTGSGAASTTEISGENWKGLQTEYFLGNTCFNVIGRANAEHAFVLDFCDEEASFGRQLPVLRGLLRVLRVR